MDSLSEEADRVFTFLIGTPFWWVVTTAVAVAAFVYPLITTGLTTVAPWSYLVLTYGISDAVRNYVEAARMKPRPDTITRWAETLVTPRNLLSHASVAISIYVLTPSGEKTLHATTEALVTAANLGGVYLLQLGESAREAILSTPETIEKLGEYTLDLAAQIPPLLTSSLMSTGTFLSAFLTETLTPLQTLARQVSGNFSELPFHLQVLFILVILVAFQIVAVLIVRSYVKRDEEEEL